MLRSLVLGLAGLSGLGLEARAFTGTDTGTTPNFCLPDEDSFDWGDCYRFNFEVMGSSMGAITAISAQVGIDTAAIQVALDAEEAARIAADFNVGAATKTFGVWQGTMTPHIATYDVWKGTVSPRLIAYDAFISTAGPAITSLDADLTQEISDRATADSTLTSAINSTGSALTTEIAQSMEKFYAVGASTKATNEAVAAEVALALSKFYDVGASTKATNEAAATETAARIAADFEIGASTKATNEAVALKAPLTGVGTSGTWGISITGTASGAPPTGTAGGNLSGTYPNPAVASLPAISGSALTNLTAANIAAGTAGISVTGNAATVTTNANLTGPITSAGNATTIAGPVPPATVDLSTVTTALATKQATGNYITALTGAVTASGPGSVAATIVGPVPPSGVDLSTVATALAGKAPLTGGGTSGTWPITAANVTTNANLTGVVTSVGNATAIANDAITNDMIANAAVANLSGTNTGDQTNITGNAATVTTNANLTGPVTSAGNATTIVGPIPATAVDLSTVTTALAGKQATGNYVTALTGDVTASGPGSVAATIANLPAISGANLTNLTGANVTGVVPLATALNATPGDCGAGEFYTGLTASGTRTCAAPAGGGDMILASTQTVGGYKVFGSSIAVGTPAETAALDLRSVVKGGWSMVGAQKVAAATTMSFTGLVSSVTYHVQYSFYNDATIVSPAVRFGGDTGSNYSNTCMINAVGSGWLTPAGSGTGKTSLPMSDSNGVTASTYFWGELRFFTMPGVAGSKKIGYRLDAHDNRGSNGADEHMVCTGIYTGASAPTTVDLLLLGSGSMTGWATIEQLTMPFAF